MPLRAVAFRICVARYAEEVARYAEEMCSSCLALGVTPEQACSTVEPSVEFIRLHLVRGDPATAR